MKQSSKSARPRWVEHLEDRRLLSATLSASQSLLVFNAVKGSSASPTETLTITDTGSSTLTLGTPTIANDASSATADAARFSILNAASVPASLAAGQSFTFQLDYTATAVGLNKAFLDLSSNDPANPLQQIQLHGIGTAGLGGSNQPSLTRILTAYDIPTNVGEADNATVYPNPPGAGSQEVALQQLVAANASQPVTINVLASFTNSEPKPYILGTYSPGDPTDKTQLFYTPASESQSVYVQPQGITSFSPGSRRFGMYFYSSAYKYYGYSENSLNTWDTTNDHKFRFFPMETASGTVVPNQYVMTSTEYDAPGGYDFTNIVAIISNVMPAPFANTGPVINVAHSDAIPGSDTLMFNTIEDQNAKVGDTFHNTNTVTLSNTGSAALVVNSATLSDASDWHLVNPPTFPLTIAQGASTTLTVKFIATKVPSLPYNETDGTVNPNGGGVYSAALTLNSNDPATPTITLPLEGYFQTHSEDIEEPSLQTIVNVMAGYDTEISSTTIPALLQGTAANTTPTYYGDEIVSAYWTEADSTQPVSVIQLNAFHTQGSSGAFYDYPQGSSGSKTQLVNDNADSGQSLFPLASGSSSPATGSFTKTGNFGFVVSGPAGPTEYSDDSLNTDAGGVGGGHGMRFFPVYDASGKLVPNTYICTVDFFDGSGTNFDFQDQTFIISNIRPVSTGKTTSTPQSQGAAAAPASVAAVAQSDGSVSLQWVPIYGDSTLKGYNVSSSVSPTSGFSLLTPTPITATGYVDTTAPAGTTVYYRVTAVDGIGESLGTGTSTITAGTPAAGLQSASIAETPVGTVTVVTPGTSYNVTAGGPGVGASSDGFRYLYATQTGDFDVAVQVQSITVAGTYATAGILARSTLDPASPDVYMAASPVNFRFKYRTSSGATTNIAQAGSTAYPNVWVRLERVGNVFTGYSSSDGKTWTQITSITLALPTTLDLGLAVASNNNTQTTTAVLRSYGPVVTAVAPTVPAAPSHLTATGATGGINLAWSAVANATGYNVYSSNSATGTFTLLTAAPITAASYSDTSALAAAGGTVYYQVTAINSAGASSAATANGQATPTSTAPAAPTNLVAAGTNGGIDLAWSAAPTATGYNVYSSTSATGPFTLLTVSPITTASYADTSALATAGGTVFYRVVAVNAAGSSLAATVSGAGLAPITASNLTSVDINSSTAGTTATNTNGTTTITAGGPGVGGTADGLRFLYQQVTGNFDVTMQVQSITVAGTFATVGIMARASLEANAANIYMAASPVNYRFKYRTTAGGTETVAQAANTNYAAGVWVRLSRVGNVFTGYYSADGKTWTAYRSETLSLPDTIYLGVGVGSNNTTQTTTAVVDDYGNTSSVA